MQFNLIDEQWIPVKRRDGSAGMIAPWQITEGFYENPIISLNAPRPDFNGALVQFLIGLVQTTAAPANRVEWNTKLNKPSTPEELQMKFSTVRHAFELGGDGPRFMQDFEKLDVEARGIDGLLIDMPGESAREKNTDHFVKRDTVSGMCPSCCAIALFAMQTNSPEGGRGYLTSLRGGGPLTTLVIGDESYPALFHSIWFNILINEDFLRKFGNANKNEEVDMFPWLGESRTGVITTPQDVHPAQVFWGMPRRINLNFNDVEEGICSVCGKYSESLIETYREKNQGYNYKGPWTHPLTPYLYKDNVPSAVHARPGGVSYRHWLGFIQDDGKERLSAYVVNNFRENRQQADWLFRLWAFGYDMKSNKPRCWYESKMPLLYADSSIRGQYEHFVATMIKTAVEICGNVRIAIKNTMHGKPEVNSVTGKIDWRYRDIKKMPADEDKRKAKILYAMKDKSIFEEVGASFWQDTEPAFYETLHTLKTSLESGHDGVETLQAWHTSLRKEALKLFDTYVLEGPIEDADPKRVVLARRDLERFNNGNKIKELLGLPVVQRPPGKATKKKQKK